MSNLFQGKVIDINPMSQSCSDCSLQHLCLPVGISKSDIRLLDHIIKRRYVLPRDGHVLRLGDPFRMLYAIRSGSVKTYILTESGGEQITGFYLPGELIGLDAMTSARHPCGARALETSSICEIPFEHLEKLASTIPALGKQLLRRMSREILLNEELLVLLGKRSSEERLAAFLISLSNRFKERGLSSHEFNLSMSRTDIANYLGLAAETLSRLLTRFQRSGLIFIQNKHMRLENLACLRELAGVSNSHRASHENA